MINVFQPTLGDEELAAVAEVFAGGWIGRGPRTAAFEEAFAAHLGVGTGHVRSVNSCTEGMFLATELLGIGAGDDVVLPSVSFVGAGNAVAASGARPVFCDVDPRTLNPTRQHVEAALTPATKAILLLHYGGFPGEVADIAALASERGLQLVEDAACSVASKLEGRALGTLADIGVWSFDAMKILVAGDGGMLYVRDPELAERAEQLSYMGLETRSGLSAAGTKNRWWEFEVSSFARRSIINDLTAAIGLVQLEKLPSFIARRRDVYERYLRELGGLEWLRTPPPVAAGIDATYYFFWVQLQTDLRDALARHLLDRGIYTTFRYYPLHLVAAYGASDRLSGAELAAAETLCLPLHQALSDDDVTCVVEAVKEFEAIAQRAA